MRIEFSLAVLGSILSRMIDYSDALLANKYTRHVSIQVMKHASEFDLTAYEDPVFYDRLERARVQATDRLVMIQSIGRLELQVITAVAYSAAVMFYSPWLMLLLVLAVVPAFLGETHFAFPRLRQEFPSDSNQASARLPAPGRSHERSRQRTQAFQPGRIISRGGSRSSQTSSTSRMSNWRASASALARFVASSAPVAITAATPTCIWRLCGPLTIGTFYF